MNISQTPYFSFVKSPKISRLIFGNILYVNIILNSELSVLKLPYISKYSWFRLIGPLVNRTSRLFGPNSKVLKQILLHKPIFIGLYGPKFHLIGPQNMGFEMNLARKLSESNKKKEEKKFLLYTVTWICRKNEMEF